MKIFSNFNKFYDISNPYQHNILKTLYKILTNITYFEDQR